MSNVNYCSLVQNFSSAQLLNKIKNPQKRALCFLNDLPEKPDCSNVNLRRWRTLRAEINKTLNERNLGYMNNIFKFRNTVGLTCEKYKLKEPKELHEA